MAASVSTPGTISLAHLCTLLSSSEHFPSRAVLHPTGGFYLCYLPAATDRQWNPPLFTCSHAVGWHGRHCHYRALASMAPLTLRVTLQSWSSICMGTTTGVSSSSKKGPRPLSTEVNSSRSQPRSKNRRKPFCVASGE